LGAKVNITLLASKEKIETISKEVLYIDNPTDISVLVQV
jgi:hypothetical protein